MKLEFFGSLCLLVAACFQLAAADNPGEAMTESIHRTALAWLDARINDDTVAKLAPAAEAIAASVIAGGHVYAAGDPAFTDELNFRAGGWAGIKVWQPGQKFEKNDVLIIGLLQPGDKGSRFFHSGPIAQSWGPYAHTLTVHIASHNWPQVSRVEQMIDKTRWTSGLYMLDTGAPEGSGWADVALGQMATVAMEKALEGEIFAAITRKGKTPAVLGSIFEPGAEAFDEKINGKTFIDEPKLEPIPAGKLGKEFFAACRRQIAAFLEAKQPEQVRAAAKRCADCQQRKGVIWTVVLGHLHARGAIVAPELTRMFVYGPAWEWENAPKGLQAGDTLFYLGYIDYPQKELDAALKVCTDAVAISVAEGPASDRVTSIRSCWEKWDGVVALPGYPYKALASSGVVQTLQWYSLMAETQALLRK